MIIKDDMYNMRQQTDFEQGTFFYNHHYSFLLYFFIASTDISTPAQCCMNRIFRRTDAPPILRGCISINRRKRWKAQICDKGSTPKWALGGHPPPPNLGPCETLMAK